MDGSEGAKAFTDSSPSSHVVTASGDAKISGLDDEFRNAMYFDGSGDYLEIPDSEDWNFGSGDFTIDFWMNSKDISTYQSIYNQQNGTANEIEIAISSNKLHLLVDYVDDGVWDLNM